MKLNAFVIEDEPMARKNLIKTLKVHFPDINVIGSSDSVAGSVEWLKAHNGNDPSQPAPHVIFMDVELSDGNAFQIFDMVDINAHVIMTTAYDSYAVKAFEVNSLDYLLKPIEIDSLRRAIGRAEAMAELPSSVRKPVQVPASSRKTKFLVRLNDRILPVNTRDIAYFYSEAKSSYIVTYDSHSYVLDDSLDTIEQGLDHDKFFRISRNCIISEDAIDSVTKLMGSRLRLTLCKGITAYTDLTVSRARVDNFMSWLEE
jgi:DNA-binding LytR/AlgR family response regulator